MKRQLLGIFSALSVLTANFAYAAVDSSDYRLFDLSGCGTQDALTCWLGKVWQFSQVAIYVLAIAALVIAGITYMTSAGNPKQVALAKKLIVGALTGVGVMIMGRFFLVNIIGVEWIW